MLSHRTTARGVLLLTLAALLAAAVFATPATSAKKVPTIVFPLIGDFEVDDNYGDPRGNGAHAGIDTMAPRMTPVVAAEGGRIRWHTTSALAGCMLYLYGESGTTYLYIHLNNDRTAGNDNRGGCVAGLTYTVKDGAKVTAGQQIAWNGDSGDADGNPHLHFEVHPNDGADVNPYPYLVQATRLLFPARLGSSFSLGLRGKPVAAGGGRLTLRATSVRWWPGGRWTPIGSRLVELTMSKGAVVDKALADAIAATSSRSLAGRPAQIEHSVYTGRAKATAAALRGAPGALAAARVSRPGGTLVAVEPAVPTDEPDDGEWTPPWEDPADPDDGSSGGAYPPRPF
jgi:hypothetical protein